MLAPVNAPDTKLDTLNNVTVNIDVESPHDDNDLIILFVIVDKVPLLSNTRQSSCMNLALCLTLSIVIQYSSVQYSTVQYSTVQSIT